MSEKQMKNIPVVLDKDGLVNCLLFHYKLSVFLRFKKSNHPLEDFNCVISLAAFYTNV